MSGMPEPCMCGDPECSVCGPLQGYHKCPGCGRIDCEDEDCLDKREAALEEKAQARQERLDERWSEVERGQNLEWGGME